ncbi:hypothetical protein AC249_AIPGENE24385, partial [Exaiptasia diaphana]
EQCLRIVEDYGSSNNRNWILCDVNLHAKLQGSAPRYWIQGCENKGNMDACCPFRDYKSVFLRVNPQEFVRE